MAVVSCREKVAAAKGYMNKPIYIVVTCYFPRPNSWRGGFCYDFVRALKKTGVYDVRVFVPSGGDLGDYDYNGIHVHRFKYYHLKAGLFSFLLAPLNRRLFLKRAREVGIDWQDVAVYHAHEIHYTKYAIPAKQINPRLVIAMHFHSGPGIVLRTGRLGVLPIYSTFLYLYLRSCLECVDLPVFVSEQQRANLGKWFANGFLSLPVDIRKDVWFGKWLREFRLRPSIVLYNGIDYSIFNADGRRPHGNTFRIGCVGNITENKDQMTLLRALVRLRKEGFKGFSQLECIFIGSGPMLDCCKKYATDNGIDGSVEFRREIDHLQLPDFYRNIDLFVLPSWIEGFGCSYMEAYGCGVPFMGCKEVSVEEALPEQERDKWLFEKKDDKALAEKIKWFYESRPKQTLVRNFDIDVLVGEFVEHLERMRQNGK